MIAGRKQVCTGAGWEFLLEEVWLELGGSRGQGNETRPWGSELKAKVGFRFG